eukprot:TRINITY_DN5857_c0_g1_i2.p1 TRINITY_DN5857_c0_g1~~TRINITY_DN5857_c0_g1_i2.p1  ORF type:complete len:257 (-),score=50.20 TRINITY_DN5857_c0_g1_i2:84-854(-)
MAPVVSSLKALCFASLSANAAANFYVGKNYDAAGCAESDLAYMDVHDFVAAMGDRCSNLGNGEYEGYTCENEKFMVQKYTDDKCTVKTGEKTERVVKCEERKRDANNTVALWGTSACVAADPRAGLSSFSITYQKFTDATCSAGGTGAAKTTVTTGCVSKSDWDDTTKAIVLKSELNTFSNNQLTSQTFEGVTDCSGTGKTPEVKFKCGCNAGDSGSTKIDCPGVSASSAVAASSAPTTAFLAVMVASAASYCMAA